MLNKGYQNQFWAEIDYKRLKNNVQMIRQCIQEKTEIGAVIKADAYGHGMSAILKYLIDQRLIHMAVVGKKEEALEAAENSIPIPVLILGYVFEEEIEEIICCNFIYSAYNLKFLRNADKIGRRNNKVLKVHIRIDVLETGMGFHPFGYLSSQNEIFNMQFIEVCGIYAHLYSAYEFREEIIRNELSQFDSIVQKIPKDIRQKITVHVASSAIIFEYPEYQYDMIRVGTALYGLPCHPVKNFGLEAILSIKGKIFATHKITGKNRVSYKDGSIEVSKSKDIARILFGYWDCPLLMTKESIKVWIKGNLYEMMDEPCMDNSCIDITNSHGIKKGDEVIVLGYEEGVTLYDILERQDIDMVHSEWMCILSKRLPKVYLNRR